MSVQIAVREPAFELARRAVLDAHDELSLRLAGISRGADELLTTGWAGPAAGQYAQAWAEWEQGAARVLCSLLDLSVAMAVAVGDLTSADAGAADDAGRLHGRLFRPSGEGD